MGLDSITLVRQHHSNRPVSRRCLRNSRPSSPAIEDDRQWAGFPGRDNSASFTQNRPITPIFT